MDSEENIEMHELVIVGSRYSKHLKDRLLPIYEKGEPMSAEDLGRLLGGMTLVVRPVEDNTFDFHAVGARTEENLFLGFVWMYQSYALREWMMDQGVKCIKARIKRVNTKYGLIFAEVKGMTLKCQVRDNYSIVTNWASGLPRVLAYNNSMSLDVAMFLLREALTENMDYEQVSRRFDNLLEYLPTDLSAHYYRECVELYHLMEQSPSEKVRDMRDTLLHTFVNRGSAAQMEWWVKECLPRFISLAEDNNLLGLDEAANFKLERVEALLESVPQNLFYLYKYDRVHFAKQLYYTTLPNDVYNRLLTLLAVREVMLGKMKEKKEKPQREEEVCDEELFHFIHPEIEAEEALRIHQAIKRAVAYLKSPEICAYLKELKQKGKVMLPPSPTIMYNELVRLGMPTGKGFSEKYFSSCYIK